MHKAAEATLEKDDVVVFCPLVKVDAAKREVWGVVTAEEPDKDGEICDYETTVPYYKAMVKEMGKASSNENIFPLRAMHGLVAAGKGISIEFRKEAKEIYMGFKVVDDAEWKKVEENVYTGFSQGGRYIKKWKDGDYMRYTSKPIEVSLVDVPCCTRAHFDYVKTDGTIEMRKFAKTEPVGQGEGELPSSTTLPIHDVALPCSCACLQCKAGNCGACSADGKCSMNEKTTKYLFTDSEGKGTLPYTDKAGKPNLRLMRAAWAALHGKGEAPKCQGIDQLKALKLLKRVYILENMELPSEKEARIGQLVKTGLEDAINRRAYGMLNKGMYTVSRFAQLTEDIKYLWMSMEYERENEGDESPVTDDVKEAYEDFLDHLLAYTEEQVLEAQAVLSTR